MRRAFSHSTAMLLTLVLGLSASRVCAIDYQPYFTADAGLAFQQDAIFRVTDYYNFTLKQPMKFDTGYRTDLRFGLHFDNHVDLELETGFIHNAVANKIFAAPGAQAELDQIPIMLNAIYHIPLRGPVRPFVGVGFGTSVGIIDASAPFVRGETHTDLSFALQAMAGAEYSITPNLDLGITYKFMQADGYRWFFTHAFDQSMNQSLNHALLLSLKWKFGQSPKSSERPSKDKNPDCHKSVTEESQFYFAGEAGRSFQQSVTLSSSAPYFGVLAKTRAEFRPGFRTGLHIGHHFTNHIDLELETGFIRNAIGNPEVLFSGLGTQADVDQIPLMVNGIYHVPCRGPIHPFLGVGAGCVVGIFEGTVVGAPALNETHGAVALGLQAIAGLECTLSRNVDIGVTYKPLYGAGYDWHFEYGLKNSTADSINHSIMAMVRVKF